jgi:hypothetical protein
MATSSRGSVSHSDHAAARWQTTPAGAQLLAWDGYRDQDGQRQARLYRALDGRFLLYEQCHSGDRPSEAAVPATCHEVDSETARGHFSRLRVRLVAEEVAFTSCAPRPESR